LETVLVDRDFQVVWFNPSRSHAQIVFIRAADPECMLFAEIDAINGCKV